MSENMRSAAAYWQTPDDERREFIIAQASRRTCGGVANEEIPDFLLIDRLAVELAGMVREKREDDEKF